MLIKGKARGGAASLSQHLENTEENERVALMETRGVVANDLDGALREIAAVGSGAASKRPFYHASISPDPDEPALTDAQKAVAIDRLEKALGLTDQPRAVIEHGKKGREHMHVVWSRIDTENMRAISDSHNYRTHEEVSRELEREFGHKRIQGAHVEREGKERPDRTPSHNEMQQAKRTGLSPQEAKELITPLWQTTDSGKAFMAAVEEKGWAVARGDKRDFVLIDPHGEAHSLARRVEGAKVKDVRERMADIDPASLPSVEQARAAMLERQAALANELSRAPAANQNERPATHDAAAQPQPTPAADRPLSKTAGDIRLAWSLSDSGKGFAASLDERGLTLAVVNGQEAYRSERVSAFAQAIGSYAPRYREGELVVLNAYGNAYQINQRTTGTPSAEIDKYLATVDRGSLLDMAQTRDVVRHEGRESFLAAKQAARPLTKIETKILAAHTASKDGATFLDHLAQDGLSLAKVTSGDLARRNFDREAFSVTATMAQRDEQTTLRREGRAPRLFEGKIGELVAVNRYGGVYRLNAHKIDTAALEARAAEVAPLRGVTETRDEKLTIRAAVREERQIAQAERIAAWETFADRQRSKTGDPLAKAGSTLAATEKATTKASARVVTGMFKGLASLAESFLSIFESKPVRTPEQQREDAKGEALDRVEQEKHEQREAREAKREADREQRLQEYRDQARAKEQEAETRRRYEETHQQDYGGRERERER